MSMCRVFSCVVERVFAMTSAFSWQNSISLYPASFHIPRPNLPVTPGVSWLSTFAFQSLIMKRTSFLGVSSKGLVGLHRTVQLQVLQCYWLRYRLRLPWYWMVCLGNKQRSFCRFWDCIQVLRFRLFTMLNLWCLTWVSQETIGMFYFVNLFYSYWSVVAFQCCVHFYCAAKWFH